jgi:predicted DNA-binding transcriptional regulator YafY
VLADKLDISLRTLYRDIESLRAQGANIDGEAGIGYLLRNEFELSKLMPSEAEIEALVLVCDGSNGMPTVNSATQRKTG